MSLLKNKLPEDVPEKKKRFAAERKRFLTGVTFLVVSFFVTACGGMPEDIVFVTEMPDDVVMIVGDERATASQMRLLLGNNRNYYGNVYSLDLWESPNESVQEELSEYVKNITISRWKKIMSMNALAKAYEISLSEKDLKSIDNAAENYYSKLSESETEVSGAELSDVQYMYKLLALSDMVYDELTREVSFEVSDDESRVMEIMMIYTADDEVASKVEEELSEGGDFGALATNYNEYESIEMNLYRGMLDEDVEEAAFMLEDGEYTQKITGDDGWYFVYCVDKFNEELSEQNKENIVRRRRKEAFNDIYDLFEDSVEFRFNEELWEEITDEDLSKIKNSEFFEVFDSKFVSTQSK